MEAQAILSKYFETCKKSVLISPLSLLAQITCSFFVSFSISFSQITICNKQKIIWFFARARRKDCSINSNFVSGLTFRNLTINAEGLILIIFINPMRDVFPNKAKLVIKSIFDNSLSSCCKIIDFTAKFERRPFGSYPSTA